MLRRSIGTFERFSRARSRPPTTILPFVGSSSLRSSRTSVDLPEPEAPTTNTNSPLSMWKVTSRSATTSGSYTFVTDSNTIIEAAVGRAAATGASSTAAACVVVISGSSTGSSRAVRNGRSDSAVRRSVAHPGDGFSSHDPSGRACEQILVDERIEVSVEDGLRVSRLVSRSRILDQLVGVEDVRADRLAAEAGVGRSTPFLRQQCLALLLGALDEARAEHPHRGLLVRRLRALVLDRDDDAGRQVRDPHRAVGLVDVLTARALRAVRVDLQIGLVDLHVGVVREQRRDDDRAEGVVAAVRLVERAQADETVLAALGLQHAVGVLARDRQRRRLETRLLPRARLEQLDAEAARRRPPLVHPQHHLRPVLRVRAAGPRLQRHHRVARVVLAVEERRLLQAVELAPQRLQRRDDLGLELAAVHRRELARVVVLATEPAVVLEATRDACVLGGDARGTRLVVPEAGSAQLLFERGKAAFELLGVKGTHGPSRAGPRAPRAARSEVRRAPPSARWYPRPPHVPAGLIPASASSPRCTLSAKLRSTRPACRTSTRTIPSRPLATQPW